MFNLVNLQWSIIEKAANLQDGKVGYAIMWLFGVPLPLLVLWYFLFDRK